MSPTEQFYKAICDKLGITRTWAELHPQEQHQIVMGINLILQVVYNGGK